MAHKKKKEEFDPSLTGGYLPGARAPVSVAPVGAPLKLSITNDFLTWRFQYIPRGTSDVHPKEEPPPLARQFLIAWWEYATGMGPVQIGLQTPQAYGLYRYGFYPTFAAALFFEFVVATAITSTVLTALDPGHKWEGGFDETQAGKGAAWGFRMGWETGPLGQYIDYPFGNPQKPEIIGG